MQPSIARRRARRRNGGRRRGPGAARTAAIILPLFLFGTLLAMASVVFVGAVSAYSFYSKDLPDPTALERIVLNEQSVIYDRTGTVELMRFGDQRREVVTFAELSPVLLDATTAVEDKTFWTNSGFDPFSILSAAIDTLNGSSRGASTITQQLVRQRLLDPALVQDPERKTERKIKEILQSIRVTQAYPGLEGKQRIITAYLNQNFYGNNDYGVLAAAKDYFGVTDLNDLSLAQAAVLAAIPQSPTEYDLVHSAVAQDDGTLVVPASTTIAVRRNLVLDLMAADRTPISDAAHKTYTAADYAAAKASLIVLAPRPLEILKAPHFVWAVRKELTSLLCDPGAQTCPTLERGGLKIISTLDWGLQQIGERWVKAAILVPHASDPAAYAKQIGVTYKSWMARLRSKDVRNGALVAIDYQTGEIVTYVGSADYYSTSSSKKFQPQFDVVADGWRQSGSAFKPFNYVTGIDDHTMTAATMFMDVTTNFSRSGKKYIPTDADTLERGPLRLRQGLQFSLNIPAVKALAYNGVDHVFENARKMGLRFQVDRSNAGLTLTLGTQETHPIDLVTGYGTIANGGRYIGHTSILKVLGADGKDVISPYVPPAGEQIVSPQAAYIVTDILNGNTILSVNRWWGIFKVTDKDGHRRPATLKTGTNNDAKDLNAYGYIAPPDEAGRARGEYALAVGVWDGNSDNSLVSTRGNPIYAIEISPYEWQGFLNQATKDWQINSFKRPKGIVEATIDAYSGMAPGAFTTKTVKELFIAGTQPKTPDTTKVALQVDSVTGLLWQDGCIGTPVTKVFLDLTGVESAFPNWQAANLDWLARARKGTGVKGGPLGTTRTTYLVSFTYHPFGATWGAPIAPIDKCVPGLPPPTPSGGGGGGGGGGGHPSPTPTPPGPTP
jgi:peptidoglycan glycosyltransferase